MTTNNPLQPELLYETPTATGPVTCLGMTFADDEERRAYFTEQLRAYLQEPTFRAIEGFPIGADDDILALSDPPYYTACPNPFLPQIIAHWQQERATLRAALNLPNDTPLENDAVGITDPVLRFTPQPYHREPFATDVSEGKNDPIYNAHSYHTKVPHKAIMRYILHYTDPGDIVFDGFCGTGMTGVAAQLCGDRKTVESLGYRVASDGMIFDGDKAISRLGPRKAVLNDLSPAATFIAYNYNTPVDVAAFAREATRILQEVEDELGWMYETWHPHCDDPNRVKARIDFTVWSDVFICPNCGTEIVLWDVAVDTKTRKVADKFICADCHSEYVKSDLDRATEAVYDHTLATVVHKAKQKPVLIQYRIGKNKLEKKPDACDLNIVHEIQALQTSCFVPNRRIDEDIDLWYERDYRSLGIYSIDAFYSKRNLHMTAFLWDTIRCTHDLRMRNRLLCWIQSVTMGFSRLNRYRKDGFSQVNQLLSGTLYVGAFTAEITPWYALTGKISRIAGMSSASIEDRSCLSTSSTASSLLSDDSIDYIFIDPPFGGNIIYSDLSIIWESWLKLATNPQEEIVVHRRKKTGKTLSDYQLMMESALTQMYRALKPGRWITVEFHNTKNAVWNAIQEAMLRAGFVIADVRTMDKQLSTFKQVTASGATKQDLIISAYKPTTTFEQQFLSHAGTTTGVWEFVRQHLTQVPPVVINNGILETVAERQNYLLFDRMIAYHIQRGVAVPMGAAQFYAGLDQHFTVRDGMYFLPEQVAGYDKARLESGEVAQLSLFVNDEKSAITWLRQQLQEPQSFQQIQPRFLQELHQARHEDLPDLRVLLEENFLPDDEGSWYVPDPNRAEDLEKLRLRGLLREFNQYKEGKKKLRQFRSEAIRAGFAHAWKERDFATIVAVAERLPELVLQEDPDLLMYYDNASLRV